MASSKVNQRTAFIFFLEWQYHQRREFLFHIYRQQIQHMEKERAKEELRKQEEKMTNAEGLYGGIQSDLNFPTITNVEEFIYVYNKKRSRRYCKDSNQLLEEYLNGEIKLDNLGDLYPSWIPRQHPVAAVRYDEDGNPVDVENIRPGNDGSETEHKRSYDKIMKSKSSLKSEHKTEMHDPQDGVYCFFNTNAKTYNTDGIDSKKVTDESLEGHLIGMWLWDQHITYPIKNLTFLIKAMLAKFPGLSTEKEAKKAEKSRNEQAIYNKHRERFRMIKNEIGYTTLADAIRKATSPRDSLLNHIDIQDLPHTVIARPSERSLALIRHHFSK